MEPLALAAITTIVITGALNRVGELALDSTVEQFKKLISSKDPKTLKKLQAAAANPNDLSETIKVMATLIENDAEVKAVAEKVAKENETKPYVINMMKNVEILNQGTINNPIFNFT